MRKKERIRNGTVILKVSRAAIRNRCLYLNRTKNFKCVKNYDKFVIIPPKHFSGVILHDVLSISAATVEFIWQFDSED